MDMPTVDDCTSTRKHESKSSLNAFGRGFGSDRVATGLLSAHRLGPLTIKHLASSVNCTYDHFRREIRRPIVGHKLLAPVRILRHERRAGAPPLLLQLTKKGFEHLCAAIQDHWCIEHPEQIIGEFSAPQSSIDWRGKRIHRLALVDLLLAVEKSARNHGGAFLETVLPEYAQWGGLAKPTLITLSISSSFQADAVLRMNDGHYSWLIMVEIDLGTETITSQAQVRVKDTIEGKARNYWSYLRSRRFISRFKVDASAFQVAIVTTTEQRVEKMRAAVAGLGLLSFGGLSPADIFFFTTTENANDDFFGNHWIDLNGRKCRLVREDG